MAWNVFQRLSTIELFFENNYKYLTTFLHISLKSDFSNNSDNSWMIEILKQPSYKKNWKMPSVLEIVLYINIFSWILVRDKVQHYNSSKISFSPNFFGCNRKCVKLMWIFWQCSKSSVSPLDTRRLDRLDQVDPLN